MASLGLLKIKVFWNKGYDVIISVHDVKRKISSRDSKYIVHGVMWPKFGNSSISMGEVINLNFIMIWPEKKFFFERWSYIKLNTLRLALAMALKFYTSGIKGFILKARKF